MPFDAPLAESQAVAYKNCLRVLSAQKLDWSKHKLLSSLRKTLKISQDAHMKYLEEVLEDPEIKELSRGLSMPKTVADVPAAQSAATIAPHSRRCATPPVLQSAPDTPKARRPPKKVARQSAKMPKAPLPCNDESASDDDGNTSTSTIGTPVSDVGGIHLHQIGPSGVNSLIGHRVECFWEDNDPQWVEAVITDYRPLTREHCLTYDFNTEKESWEWADLGKEISSGQVQLLSSTVNLVSGETTTSHRALKNRKCQKLLGKRPSPAPYETSFFTDRLVNGSLSELEGLLEGIVKRQKVVLNQLLSEGEAAHRAADPMVQALAQRERLERRAEEVKSELALLDGAED
ncbi:unnamed protein product [Ostreobium quekettii]|uniref:ENT domain-containing protein n=1 Tax=Ostreobium quekettii TaxID=121088 RepID=A0A8S1JB54_9CHLO|nr:unnamed protein product [Ostreobium quekettii]|eukprot:evm.model.scf_1723.1 EVM.evm.TU.scf_1723.1   scf_1723:15884-22297(+)